MVLDAITHSLPLERKYSYGQACLSDGPYDTSEKATYDINEARNRLEVFPSDSAGPSYVFTLVDGVLAPDKKTARNLGEKCTARQGLLVLRHGGYDEPAVIGTYKG